MYNQRKTNLYICYLRNSNTETNALDSTLKVPGEKLRK